LFLKNGVALRQHDNSFFGDPVLFQRASQLSAPLLPELAELGAYAASEEVDQRARLIMRYRPQLHLADNGGASCDEVDLHPAYHSLLTRARHVGIASSLFENNASETSVRHQARAIRLLLLSGVECATCQELCLSSAALAILQHDKALWTEWKPLLISPIHDPLPKPYPQKQGASLSLAVDESSPTEKAQAIGIYEASSDQPAVVRLYGGKKAVINPLADGFLVSALFEGQQCLFLVPHWLADGRLNSIRLSPAHSVPSAAYPCADVHFSASVGWHLGQVGASDQLLHQAHIALQCDVNVMRVGIMRRALRLAVDRLRHDKKNGHSTQELTIRARILADAALDCAAATLLVLRIARAFDRVAAEKEKWLIELAQPLISYWLSQIAPQILACTAMETVAARPSEGSFHHRASYFLSLHCGFDKTATAHLLDALVQWQRHDADMMAFLAELTSQVEGGDEQNSEILATAVRMTEEDPSAACLFAEQFVYRLAAAAMRSLDMDIVTTAFINSRLSGQWRSCYGALDLRFNPTFILETLYPSQ